ncbi:nucleotide sugar dehydrogenase [Acidaminococcus sp.]|uniref:nucleotide sugar dehydrogenase n=1 Tax=Acidaminococcus sp. TaxID=1872103 RepID=UPI003D7D26E7
MERNSERIGETTIAVVGLGYVGLPLALAFAKKYPTLGYDVNEAKLALYRQGVDPTQEAGDDAVAHTTLEFTGDPVRLEEASFIIVAVPTPVSDDRLPDLTPVRSASRTVGQHLRPGTIVCYESTVYPGATEEVCGSILEQESGLKAGRDFHLAYSPERINPGDKEHRLQNIRKIVSGDTPEVRDQAAALYGSILEAPVYPASCIKVAEAAKLIENTQRDVNIAFMNDVSMACHAMGIDTQEVIDAMDTKWNALHFRPGLVGGHCIGVDPYYYLYEAERKGHLSTMTAVSRRINSHMSDYVVAQTLREMIRGDLRMRQAPVVLLGITFKEDCPDTRNSRSMDIYHQLKELGFTVQVVDPQADMRTLPEEIRKDMIPLEQVRNAQVLLFAVRHREFRALKLADLDAMYDPDTPSKILIDVKGMYHRDVLEQAGYQYWRL